MDNGNAPATKADIAEVKQEIADVKQELKQEIADVKQELKQEIADVKQEIKRDIAMHRSETHHAYDSLIERIADSETKLLKAFYTFAESNPKRLAEVETESAAMKSRLATIEERLTDVEKRLNMPPAA